jgi:signal transduction histidine kinase
MARRSLRTQLTLLYAVPFLASGALLLGVPLSQTSSTEPVGGGPPAQSSVAEGPDLALYAVVLGAMVVVAIVLGWLVAGRFLRPLRTIVTTARDISATNLHRRLGDTGRGEFGVLAGTLDDLFARLEAAFESQRRFVANAAHELRTPLTAERTLLQVALADPHADTEALRSACHEVLALGAAQERLINALLTLASGEQGVERREPFDLAAIARDAVAVRREEAGRRGVRVEASLAAAPASGDASLVESLVANLVDNAIRYNAPGGRVEVSTSATGSGALVRVWNTGPVVPPGDVGRLFQPFQRLGRDRLAGGGAALPAGGGPPVGRPKAGPGRADGHGLGLAIVHAIARAHGAALSATARPEGGLDIEVAFPGDREGPAADVVADRDDALYVTDRPRGGVPLARRRHGAREGEHVAAHAGGDGTRGHLGRRLQQLVGLRRELAVGVGVGARLAHHHLVGDAPHARAAHRRLPHRQAVGCAGDRTGERHHPAPHRDADPRGVARRLPQPVCDAGLDVPVVPARRCHTANDEPPPGDAPVLRRVEVRAGSG